MSPQKVIVLRRWQVASAFVALTAAFVAMGVILGVQVGHNRDAIRRVRQLERLGAQAHVALCTFKADLRERVRDGRRFLADHPDGFAGITAATIRQSLTNQQKTVDSLAELECGAA